MRKDKRFPTQLTADVRRKTVLQKIAEGKSFYTVIDELVKEWNITECSAKDYVRTSIDYLASEEFKDVMKGINTQRIEQIITESMGTDNKTALKAIDLANKTAGIYEERVKLETNNDVEIHFNV